MAQGYDRIQKNQLETKKNKAQARPPGEEKNFFYLHKKKGKKKECDAHHRAPQLLTV